MCVESETNTVPGATAPVVDTQKEADFEWARGVYEMAFVVGISVSVCFAIAPALFFAFTPHLASSSAGLLSYMRVVAMALSFFSYVTMSENLKEYTQHRHGMNKEQRERCEKLAAQRSALSKNIAQWSWKDILPFDYAHTFVRLDATSRRFVTECLALDQRAMSVAMFDIKGQFLIFKEGLALFTNGLLPYGWSLAQAALANWKTFVYSALAGLCVTFLLPSALNDTPVQQ